MVSAKQAKQICTPLDFILHILSTKWTTAIVNDLRGGPKRPSELSKALPGISAKTLTQRLRELEQYGFLARECYDEIPPRVVYNLTGRGADLVFLLAALDEYSRAWLPTLESLELESTDSGEHFELLIEAELSEVESRDGQAQPPSSIELDDTDEFVVTDDEGNNGDKQDSFFTFSANDYRKELYEQLKKNVDKEARVNSDKD